MEDRSLSKETGFLPNPSNKKHPSNIGFNLVSFIFPMSRAYYKASKGPDNEQTTSGDIKWTLLSITNPMRKQIPWEHVSCQIGPNAGCQNQNVGMSSVTEVKSLFHKSTGGQDVSPPVTSKQRQTKVPTTLTLKV